MYRMALQLSELRSLTNTTLRDLGLLRLVGQEAMVLARQAKLLARELDWSPSAPLLPGDDVVVLLHGLFATAGVFRPMKDFIEQQTRAKTASFTYSPSASVDAVAQRLARVIAGLPDDVNIHLVGHSMGGLAARWFVQVLGGDPRVVQTISLAAPFQGTNRARFWPTPAGRDLSPGSAVLQELRITAGRGRDVPHLSIAASVDQLVPSGACFSDGEYVVIEECGHNGLLYHSDVASEIVRRIHLQSPPPSSRSWRPPPFERD